MIKTINVNNFMSLRGFSLKPSLRNVLVGPNLAGKSNIIRALKFLTHISVPGLGLATAVNSYGGFSEILWKGIDEGEISFFLSAEIFLSEKDKPRNYEYELSLIGSAITGSFVIGNEKLIRRDDGAEYILAENVDIGLKVQKYGRTTALTKGAVNAINATINVGYSSGTARFGNQIRWPGVHRFPSKEEPDH